MNRYLLKFMCFFMALFAAHQVNAATVFVKGNNSTYVKVGDNYQKAEASVQTSDGVTWYYTDVADNSTISFATANNGSNISPEFTIGTGEAYFFYNGSAYAINMTAMKDAQSYLLLEVTTNNWDKDGASFWIWDGQDNVKLTYTGGDKSGKNVYLYKTNKNTSGTFYFKRCWDNNPDNKWNEFSYNYTKGGYYKATDGSSGELTSASEYKNVIWPEKPAPVVNALQHNWGGNGWFWKDLDENNSVVAVYHSNDGVDYGYKNGDSYTKIAYIQPNNLIKVGDPQNGDECTFTFNPTNNTVTVTKAAEKWIDKVYILGVTNDWNTGTEVGSFHGVYTYSYTANSNDTKKHWAYRVVYNDGSTKYFTPNNANVAIALDATQNYTIKDARGEDSWYCEAITAGCTYDIVLNTNDGTVKIVRTGGFAEGDIPVYPEGVNSEAELLAYDFSAQPVYYLLGKVLNNNRVSPEWQMTKGADGKYHLNGFAMRHTWCLDWDGDIKNKIDGKVKVRQYTAVDAHTDLDEQEFYNGGEGKKALPANPLTEGRLFNATFDPATGKLSLDEDLSANYKMPFISLVGYKMQQDQVYTTPRGVEAIPAGVTTAKGWQEAWLQYDAAGKLLKDRRGNVMYSTMWPPKNPVYFTANVGGERQYSSDQMTFKPVKGNDGVYVAKTGAEWEAELKNGENADAYHGLDLDDSKTYYRYVVEDIWYVGASKIWTGWGGQTTNSESGPIAQWSNHRNWGYSSRRANDEDGTAINAETTYGVNTSDGANGNFLFSDPTFFKTIEFFYDNADPEHSSKIYTTLAYGSASIAAKSNKESDDTYKKGSYQPTVNVPEGVTVTGYTIYRYDAATNQLAPIGNDGGLVAQGTNNPDATTFEFDTEGLAEGRYYYVLTVNFSNDRTATVRSNPFIIHFPGQYTLEVKGYQLVKLNEPFTQSGVAYDYVTYISEKDANMYFVNLSEDGNVTAYASVQGENRAGMQTKFAQNVGIKWTDKVFVYGQVPSEFKKDADKANATVSTDDIQGYSLTAGAQTATVDAFGANHNLATIDNQYNFAAKTYKAVMNYLEKDIEGDSKTAKTTLGKESYTTMKMPNVTAGASAVTVTKTENTEVLNIIDGDETKEKASDYYTVDVALTFNDPNVIAQNAPRYEVAVSKDGEQTVKVYKAQNEGARTVKISGVNPVEFENATLSVSAKYFDGEDFNLPATIGEDAVLEAGDAKFQKLTWPVINSVAAVTSTIKDNGEDKPVVFVTAMSTEFDGGDKIGNTNLGNDCIFNVDFAIEGRETPDFSSFVTLDEINFTGELQTVDKHHVWVGGSFQFDNNSGKDEVAFKASVTPIYVAKVTNAQNVENLEEATVVSAAPAEAAYVALRGNTAEKIIEDGIVTGINDITTSDAPKARKVIENGQVYIICGERKFNVMGAEIK